MSLSIILSTKNVWCNLYILLKFEIRFYLLTVVANTNTKIISNDKY